MLSLSSGICDSGPKLDKPSPPLAAQQFISTTIFPWFLERSIACASSPVPRGAVPRSAGHRGQRPSSRCRWILFLYFLFCTSCFFLHPPPKKMSTVRSSQKVRFTMATNVAVKFSKGFYFTSLTAQRWRLDSNHTLFDYYPNETHPTFS